MRPVPLVIVLNSLVIFAESIQQDNITRTHSQPEARDLTQVCTVSHFSGKIIFDFVSVLAYLGSVERWSPPSLGKIHAGDKHSLHYDGH